MVSLISELTDAKGRRAKSGWVLYDADCSFCMKSVRWMSPILERRGFGFAPLQDPRVQAMLGLPPEELLAEMRVLTPEGKQYGGADAFVFLARSVWWAWPVVAFAYVPGGRWILRKGYRFIAERRSCQGGTCTISAGHPYTSGPEEKGAAK